MDNKNTVIDAKIGNLNELTKVLSVKEQAQEQLLVVMKALGIGKIVRNLKFEKAQRYTLTSLFISLLIMRLCGKTIAGATSNHFHGLCAVSKNTPYRALLNARIDWRMLLTKVKSPFASMPFSWSIRWIPTSMTLVPSLIIQPFRRAAFESKVSARCSPMSHTILHFTCCFRQIGRMNLRQHCIETGILLQP